MCTGSSEGGGGGDCSTLWIWMDRWMAADDGWETAGMGLGRAHRALACSSSRSILRAKYRYAGERSCDAGGRTCVGRCQVAPAPIFSTPASIRAARQQATHWSGIGTALIHTPSPWCMVRTFGGVSKFDQWGPAGVVTTEFSRVVLRPSSCCLLRRRRSQLVRRLDVSIKALEGGGIGGVDAPHTDRSTTIGTRQSIL